MPPSPQHRTAFANPIHITRSWASVQGWTVGTARLALVRSSNADICFRPFAGSAEACCLALAIGRATDGRDRGAGRGVVLSGCGCAGVTAGRATGCNTGRWINAMSAKAPPLEGVLVRIELFAFTGERPDLAV